MSEISLVTRCHFVLLFDLNKETFPWNVSVISVKRLLVLCVYMYILCKYIVIKKHALKVYGGVKVRLQILLTWALGVRDARLSLRTP
jgi:hypothetical protein